MNKPDKNITPDQNFDKLTEDFFSKVQVSYKKSKEEIWSELDPKLTPEITAKHSWIFHHRVSLAIAASLIILLGIAGVMRFYTTTINNPAGQHLLATLPDGSTVELNANSILSYKPYWWRFSRTVQFEGEGFFKVQKGDKFTVVSSLASTQVLGTSFNIYARNGQYQVTCHTGKVKVISKSKDEGILSPGYEAKLSLDGKVVIYKSPDMKSSISWIDNKFIFTAIPLKRVFEEIERQYNVNITMPENLNYTYTGYFTKDKSVDSVMGLVCKPFGLSFVTKSGHGFLVVPNEEAK